MGYKDPSLARTLPSFPRSLSSPAPSGSKASTRKHQIRATNTSPLPRLVMMYSLTTIALFFSLSSFVIASPIAWDGGPAYSGASSPTGGGGVTGDGGIHLIKILSHDGQPGGYSTTGEADGGHGGNGSTRGKHGKGKGGGSGGGSAYTGAAGPSEGGNAETDDSLSVIDLLSDNAGPGGTSSSGDALGGPAGNL